MAGESAIAVPASFVNLLRETVVTQLADCAIEISDSGRVHPEGIEEQGDSARPSGDTQRRKAQRRARQIERFLSSTGLETVEVEVEDHPPDTAHCENTGRSRDR